MRSMKGNLIWKLLYAEPYTHLFNTALRRSLSEYCQTIWYVKTKMVDLPDGENGLNIFLVVLMQYTNMMDKHSMMA